MLWEGGSRWTKKPESSLFALILTGADVVGVVLSIRNWEPQGWLLPMSQMYLRSTSSPVSEIRPSESLVSEIFVLCCPPYHSITLHCSTLNLIDSYTIYQISAVDVCGFSELVCARNIHAKELKLACKGALFLLEHCSQELRYRITLVTHQEICTQKDICIYMHI